jgi:hypothetical protein
MCLIKIARAPRRSSNLHLYTALVKFRIPNLTPYPILVRKNDHFCQVRTVYSPDTAGHSNTLHQNQLESKSSVRTAPYSSLVSLDPDNILPSDTRDETRQALLKHDNVFSPSLEGYNGHAGSFEAHVNMGPVQPPQRKGRLPQYTRNQLELLQSTFYELEAMGVFKCQEDVGVQVVYLNLSFPVKKKKDKAIFALLQRFRRSHAIRNPNHH